MGLGVTPGCRGAAGPWWEGGRPRGSPPRPWGGRERSVKEKKIKKK